MCVVVTTLHLCIIVYFRFLNFYMLALLTEWWKLCLLIQKRNVKIILFTIKLFSLKLNLFRVYSIENYSLSDSLSEHLASEISVKRGHISNISERLEVALELDITYMFEKMFLFWKTKRIPTHLSQHVFSYYYNFLCTVLQLFKTHYQSLRASGICRKAQEVTAQYEGYRRIVYVTVQFIVWSTKCVCVAKSFVPCHFETMSKDQRFILRFRIRVFAIDYEFLFRDIILYLWHVISDSRSSCAIFNSCFARDTLSSLKKKTNRYMCNCM
ncbi:hypothetical protein PUN28_009303 [Cardiocondyla obscurior]|uniref:Uncharacterized protein n=1 Tax=Cardiocondyla obscurior TaxID=286306 RepID=A0AAW2FRV6_9HYME